MSKEAAQRAMREAKFAQRNAGTGSAAPTARRRPPVAPPAAPAATRAPAASIGAEPAVAGDGLCGHKSMNGRTCTREHGHTAKSHRYS